MQCVDEETKAQILADFKLRFPAFDEDQVDAILPFLIDSYCCYYCGTYEGCGKEIILNLLAHLFVLETTPGSDAFRTESSVSVDGVSASYDSNFAENKSDAFFLSTKYGQRYLMLTANSGQGVFFV